MLRKTKETEVEVELNPWGSGKVIVETPIRFLNHMVETLGFYAQWDLKAKVRELKTVDDHHVSEDLAITLGSELRNKIEGVKVARFGWSAIPMDGSLVLVSLDVSNRPGAWIELNFKREMIGDWATENIIHFLESFALNARITLHVVEMRRDNDHHLAEATFKALGLALKQALKKVEKTLSTKGAL